ncbi:MAG: hypothetical protein SF051_02800 [Elusimicrobiota bacterium]|nr:hypothetical protein [Elusimicrobiota bacterium]
MTKKKPSSAKSGKRSKAKYSKPKMTRHGNLETVAQRISGAVGSTCCVTERLRASRVSAAERERLVTDVSRLVAAAGR